MKLADIFTAVKTIHYKREEINRYRNSMLEHNDKIMTLIKELETATGLDRIKIRSEIEKEDRTIQSYIELLYSKLVVVEKLENEVLKNKLKIYFILCLDKVLKFFKLL